MADPIVIPPVTLADLTEAKVGGKGAFDVLMTAVQSQLELEHQAQRIKGQDYAQIYLGSVQAVLQNSVVFLLQKDEASQKALLVAAQVELAKAQLELLKVQIEKEGFDAELVKAQTAKVKAETANVITENDTLLAQQCLLKAQYDLTMIQKMQTTAQTSLVQQKVATEKAQITETGVDDNSVIGRQKLLYKAQTDGFQRDAEQKLAKLLTDTWNVRRTTDEATVADETNKLSDATIGRVMTIAIEGVQGRP